MKANFYNVKMNIPKDFVHKTNNGGIPTKEKTYFLYEDSFYENGKEIKCCFFSIGNGVDEQNLVKKLSEIFNFTIVGRRFHYTEFRIETKIKSTVG